jgi:hypothetical protein
LKLSVSQKPYTRAKVQSIGEQRGERVTLARRA